MKYRQPGYRDGDFKDQRDREKREERGAQLGATAVFVHPVR